MDRGSASTSKPDLFMNEIFHAIIVDDDRAAIAALEQEIELFVEDLSVIGSAQTIEEAVRMIDRMKPDIVLLDIQLQEGLGFDILEQVTWSHFSLIFTTAYHQYAIDAFKVDAVDYLLKPVQGADLQATLNRLRKSHQPAPSPSVTAPEQEKVVLTSLGEIFLFNPEEVVRCAAHSNYSQFHLVDGSKILISKTLKELEGSLDTAIFLRVHKSHIVNVHFIKRFHTKDHLLVLKDGTEIPVSQRKKAEIVRRLRG